LKAREAAPTQSAGESASTWAAGKDKRAANKSGKRPDFKQAQPLMLLGAKKCMVYGFKACCCYGKRRAPTSFTFFATKTKSEQHKTAMLLPGAPGLYPQAARAFNGQ
jgi:hypothetical protein